MATLEIRLDHFKLYDVDPVPASPHNPTLLGQFDQHAQTVTLQFLRLFANPVSKNGEDLIDRNAHLTVYDFQSPAPEPKRTVKLENQFGVQKLDIAEGVFLLAPALKIEPGIVLPQRLDHYKAYRVIQGEPINKDVSLKDQFDSEPEVRVLDPLFFCVPVLKRYNNQIHEINNPKAHLTIYSISPKEYKLRREIKDQFLGTVVSILRSTMLAVPSLKLDWAVI